MVHSFSATEGAATERVADRLIATIGLDDIVVIDTEDALLICRRDRAQDVKQIVQQRAGAARQVFMSQELTAYCVKCKTKRSLEDATPEYTSSGTPATRGVCPVCGTSLYRMGATDAHADILKPEITPKKRKKKGGKKKASKKSSEPTRRGNRVIVQSPAKSDKIPGYRARATR